MNDGEIRYLSLFSGAGGGDLACQHLLGWRCVGYVEWNKDACETLDGRIRDGFADNAQIWHQDIRDFNRGAAHVYSGMVDFVAGGPPCQPFSVAGRRAAAGDSRNMVPAMLRTIGIVRPRRILLENSPTSTFRRYLLDFIIPRLRQMGYVGRYGVISAEDAIWLNCYPGTPARYHERKRTWVVAKVVDATCQRTGGLSTRPRRPKQAEINSVRSGKKAANAEQFHANNGGSGASQICGRRSPAPELPGSGWWSIDPAEMPDAIGEGLAQRKGKPGNNGQELTASERSNSSGGDVAAEIGESDCSSCPGDSRGGATNRSEDRLRWPVESRLGRVVHGMARRVDRCRAIGEGQVPAVVDIVEEILNNGF